MTHRSSGVGEVQDVEASGGDTNREPIYPDWFAQDLADAKKRREREESHVLFQERAQSAMAYNHVVYDGDAIGYGGMIR
jgi:hypothetical protein